MMNNIVEDFAKAWNELNPELIIKHLDNKFCYDSMWVFNSLDYKGYCEYIRGKFKTIRETGALVKAKIIRQSSDYGVIGLIQTTADGENLSYYHIRIENGKVIKGDLSAFA